MNGRARGSRSGWLAKVAVIVPVLVFVSTEPVAAQVQRLTGEDLDILVDSRWAGTHYGGYFPVRIRVKNNAADRQVTFRIDRQRSVSVSRVIDLGSGATTELTLLVPRVGSNWYGGAELNVEVNGRLVEGLVSRVEFPRQHSPWPESSLLVISDDKVDFDGFDKAVHTFFRTQSGWARASSYGVSSESDRQWITPTLLPRTWLAYSGLDLVAVSLATLEAIDPEQRDAILGWVETGGHLLVTEVGGPASESDRLSTVLGFADRAAADDEWTAASSASRSVAEGFDLSPPKSRQGSAIAPPAKIPTVGPAPEETTTADAGTAITWPEGAAAFSSRAIQQGRVVAFAGDAMTGSQRDWLWFFGSQSDRPAGGRWLEWQGRHGMSTQKRQDDFLGFTVPGVGSVPVVAFLLLITVFSVVIGPVNFILLKRRGQLYLMVVTVPVIAVVTSVVMVSYALVSDGIGIQSLTRSVTFLDQRNETAVTMARVAFFAGMGPSALEFPRDTAVYPVSPSRDRRTVRTGSVDWTDRQVFFNDWVKTRTRSQLYTVRRHQLRGRIGISAADDQGRVSVDNGLEWRLRFLVVADTNGNHYLAQNIPAGGSATVEKLATSDSRRLTPILNLLSEHYSVAQEMAMASQESRGTRPGELPVLFQTGILEFSLGAFRDASGFYRLPPGSYVAIVDEDPGIERGCGTEDKESLHLLLGRY